MSIEILMETIIRDILKDLKKERQINKLLFLDRDEEKNKVRYANLIANWSGIDFLSSDERCIDDYKALIVGDLSIDELVSISEGKQINEKTRYIRDAFLRNIQVLVISEGMEHRKYKDGANKNFYNSIKEKEEQIISYGTCIIDSSQLNEKITSIKEIELYNREKVEIEENKKNIKRYKLEDKLITLPILKELLNKVKVEEIEISKDSIITSLAEDYIRERGLILRREI